VRWVRFDRASDAPAETIAIYYDSYRNLVARGILPSPAMPREPDPFPTAFVPDRGTATAGSAFPRTPSSIG